MTEALCEPFASCEGLDGRLLISAAIQGPPLAWDLGEVSFGAFTSNGVAARPYVDIHLEQTWTPKEACYAPIRSIFSLAPSETVETFSSVRHQVDFTRLVSSASYDSRSTEGPEHESVDRKENLIDAIQEQMKDKAIEAQKMRYAGGYGSFWETVANIIAPGVGGAIVNAAEGVANHVEHTSTGAADAVKDAMGSAQRAVETINRSEVQHSRSESTTTTETTETIQSIKRRFTNPYRDRSLQLRFIPVFRHFEVRTRPAYIKPGIALHVGAVRAGSLASGLAGGMRVRDVLAVAPTHVDAAALQQPLARLLSGTQDVRMAAKGGAAPEAAAGAATAGSPIGALRWSESIVREDSVLVPLAEAETAASAFGLKGKSRASFLGTLERITPDAVAKLVPIAVQHIHLFMGTHIEAVAGECVLEDLPALPAEPQF
ncbi:MAG TPA: hypothetical protein VF232_01920 [Gaiellaceae bacterium]